MTKRELNDLACCHGLCCEVETRGLAYVLTLYKNRPIIFSAQETDDLARRGQKQFGTPAARIALAVSHFNRITKRP